MSAREGATEDLACAVPVRRVAEFLVGADLVEEGEDAFGGVAVLFRGCFCGEQVRDCLVIMDGSLGEGLGDYGRLLEFDAVAEMDYGVEDA